MAMVATAVDTVATAVDMVDMVAVDTARGLLMLRLRPRLSPDMAMVATAVDTAAMAVDTAMVVTVVVMVATARGLLSPVMAMAAMVATDTAGAMATGVSYHQIGRSELSQKQKH